MRQLLAGRLRHLLNSGHEEPGGVAAAHPPQRPDITRRAERVRAEPQHDHGADRRTRRPRPGGEEELPDDVQKAGRPSLVVGPETQKVFSAGLRRGGRLAAGRLGSGSAGSSSTGEAPCGGGATRISTTWSGRWPSSPASFALTSRTTPLCVGVGASYCGMIRPGDRTVRYGPKRAGSTRPSALSWSAGRR